MTVLPYIFNTLLQLCILLLIIVLVRRFLVVILKSKLLYKKYLFFFNILVYFTWIVFVMIKVAHALNDNYFIFGSVVLIITILMWDYLKNFFLGIIFAFQYGYIIDENVVLNDKEGKLVSYSSSYFEILTNKGERFKIKFKEVYAGDFEIFSGALHRVSRKFKINSLEDGKIIKSSIMNHPVFLMNDNYSFEEEIDQNDQCWISFYFNVMNYRDANVINKFINQFSTLK